jgi:hypothetical protein
MYLTETLADKNTLKYFPSYDGILFVAASSTELATLPIGSTFPEGFVSFTRSLQLAWNSNAKAKLHDIAQLEASKPTEPVDDDTISGPTITPHDDVTVIYILIGTTRAEDAAQLRIGRQMYPASKFETNESSSSIH